MLRTASSPIIAIALAAAVVLAQACARTADAPDIMEMPTEAVATPVPPTATPVPHPDLPFGFPVDETLRPMRVTGTGAEKRIAEPLPDGPTVLEVARDLQARPQNDMLANQYGWNCRVHERHEGAPGVDWYLPEGTPVVATMRGQAELYFITTSNAFEYYGVDISLTLGLPEPTAPLYPLPGPGGGMGIFVSIVNGNLRAESGHLALSTIELVGDDAFVAPFSRDFDFEARFERPIGHDQITMVASWPVERGDVIGYVGNTGYSDVAHIHYQVVTKDRLRKFCPTYEPYRYNGWLFEPPAPLP